MGAFYDCRCTWKLASADLTSLHVSVSEVGAFVAQRRDVALSIFSRREDRETMELSIEAADEAAARAAIEEIATAIEVRVQVNGRSRSLERNTIAVEATPDVLLGAVEEGVDQLGPLFEAGLLQRHVPTTDLTDLEPLADPYERMLDQETNGANYDLDTEDIIEQLQEWETGMSFRILDVGPENVTLHFEQLPSDLAGFAAEAYAFCPDLACDYALGDLTADDDIGFERAAIDAIIQGLREDRVIRFWWD